MKKHPVSHMRTLQDLVHSLEYLWDAPAQSWRATDNLQDSIQNGKGKDNKKWVKETRNYSQLFNDIITTSKGFSTFLDKGDKVFYLCDTDQDFIVYQLAMNYAGIVSVPRWLDISPEELDTIIKHCDAETILVQNKKAFEKVASLKDKSLSNIKKIFVMNYKDMEKGKKGGWTPADKIYKEGELQQNDFFPTINPDDLATIIYTSGTTGNAKGVMLNNKNLISNAVAGTALIPESIKRMYAIAKPAHSLGLLIENVNLLSGTEMFYTSNLMQVKEDMKNFKPQMIVTVPETYEKLYKIINSETAKLKGIKSAISKIPFIFNYKVKQVFGGELEYAFCGGAKLPDYIFEWLDSLDINAAEGYGMTEASPLISGSTIDSRKGSVGKPISGVKVKIIRSDGNEAPTGEPGEILASGSNIMEGYYKNHPETMRTISYELNEKWLHTGDKGHLDADGYLRIDGRYKTMFKNSRGEYIDPEHIESILKQSPFIQDIAVGGEGLKKPVSLIYPNFGYLETMLKKMKISFDVKQMEENNIFPEIVQEIYQKELAEYSEQLPEREKPYFREFGFVNHPFPKTTTLKILRHKLDDDFKIVINTFKSILYNKAAH